MQKRVRPIAVLPLLVGSYAFAVELEPMVITATRSAETVDESLASVTVFERDLIDRRQVQSLQDLLVGVPGLGISNNGGLGKATSFFMRGTESDHVLVLIDGIRVSSATLGTASFQHFPIDQIERVEIVRGPRASLYGSDAVGGVIQIFTRKGGEGFKPVFSAGGGTHGTYKVTGGLSGSAGDGWLNVSASRLGTSGFNACDGQPFAIGGGGGCFTSEPDNDGYTNTSGSARGGYRFANGLEIEGNFLQAEGETQFDGSFVNEADFLQQVAGGKLHFSPLSEWQVTLSGGRHLDKTRNSKDGDLQSRFNLVRWQASLQNDISIAHGHDLTLGVDYYDDRVSSTTDFTKSSRHNVGAFAQYRLLLGGHDLLLSVRHDDNQQFGGNTTGNVTWGYTFGPWLRVMAGWGRAFKAPTFNELYFPGFGTPDLKPEDSESWEVGARGRLFDVDWSVSGYHTKITNLISPVFDLARCGPPFFFCAQNIGKTRILGFEAVVSTTFLDWDLNANVSLLKPEDKGSGSTHGNLLPRRAEVMFRVDLDRDFGRFRVGGSVHGEGRRFDDLANSQRLGDYALLDLRASVELYRNWSLEGRVNNLLDKDYQTARFFNQDGRNFFVGIRYQL